MFIRKKQYKELCQRIANLEQAVIDMPKEFDNKLSKLSETVANIPTEFDEKLCGFAEDVEEVQSKLSEIEDVLDKRCECLAETVAETVLVKRKTSELSQTTDEKLCVFAEIIGELQDKVSDLDDGLDRDTRKKNRKFDDDFREGIANIMSYGVLNGQETDS